MPSAHAGERASNESSAGTEDEYEYEYDENETETFYVDLDLSSVNAVIRPRLQSRKKLIPSNTTTKPSDPARNSAVGTPTGVTADVDIGNATHGTANGDAQPGSPPAAGGKTLSAAPEPASDMIQVLELHSHNPVISYQNEIYSCTWSDMIGTNMFFAEHEEDMEEAPLRSTEDYDLLAASRIKLVGRKMKLTDKPGRKGAYRNTADDLDDEGVAADMSSGKALGTLRSNNPSVNREVKRQAKFLENLMNAKRVKGQTDNVRTVYKPSRGPEGVAGGSTTGRLGPQALSQEIEELNRRVVRGDADALRRLQMIYSEPDAQAVDPGVSQAPTTAPAPAPTPGPTWQEGIDDKSSPDQTENAENT